MNKKTLSLLIVLLMVVSLVPLALPYVGAGTSSTTTPATVSVSKVNLGETHEKTQISPKEKIEPLLFDILNGKTSKNVMEIDGQKFIMIHIIAKEDISQKLRGVKVVGKTKILGNVIYMALLPVEKESIPTLIKIASIPQVEAVTRINPVEPIGAKKDTVDSSSKEKITLPHSKFAGRISEWKPKGTLDGKKVLLFRNTLSGKLRELQDKSPARKGDVTITESKVKAKTAPEPQDYFAIYHHGSWATWFNLGITGSGVRD